MKELYLSDFEDLKEELENDDVNESVTFLDDNGDVKYVMFPYDLVERINSLVQEPSENTDIKVLTPDGQTPELSYEEYEHIKSSILKAFDENFKPKPNKLN